MSVLRRLGEMLGLVQSAQDDLVSDTVLKLRAVGAVTRAHTRHQIEEYLAELEATRPELAAHVRQELAAAGLLPRDAATAPALPAAAAPAPLALPPAADPTAADPPEVTTAARKRGRPRKHPLPGEPFRPAGPR